MPDVSVGLDREHSGGVMSNANHREVRRANIPGSMQDVPLSVHHLFDRAERYFGHKTITTATATGIERTTYAEWAVRTRKLGTVLDRLGISLAGRVATFAWNTEIGRAHV